MGLAAAALWAAEPAGVILLHGKEGSPNAKYYGSFVSTLMREGFLVRTPEMPWSRGRALNRSFETAMEEVDDVVKELRAAGAKKIFIAGHSLGANATLYYGTRSSVDGVLAIAPGHVPELKGFQERLGDSVERARRMIQTGHGDERASFTDTNQGKDFAVQTTAQIYLSYMDPAGHAVMPKNAAALKPGCPLLWVIGTNDPMYERGPSYAFERAPPSHPLNKYLVVRSNHLNTPEAATGEIVVWLKAVNP